MHLMIGTCQVLKEQSLVRLYSLAVGFPIAGGLLHLPPAISGGFQTAISRLLAAVNGDRRRTPACRREMTHFNVNYIDQIVDGRDRPCGAC